MGTTKKIEETAKEFQKLDLEKKAIEAKIKPLKAALVDYAKANKKNLDEHFRLNFKSGGFVLLKVQDVLFGDKNAMEELAKSLTDPELLTIKVNDKEVISRASKDAKLRKELTQKSIEVGQKEVWAVYSK